MENKYYIANKNIRIVSQHNYVHNMCSEYVSNQDATDFEVIITKDDLFLERQKSEIIIGQNGYASHNLSEGYLESLAVYRKITEKMIEYNTILVHGSCVAYDGKGYLFTAKSGVGKSTHANLWKQFLGEDLVIINDDKPLISIQNNEIKAFGTPWNGKHHLGVNASVNLKSICVIERSSTNHIEHLSTTESYPIILQQVYRPNSEVLLTKTLDLIDKLVSSIDLWTLHCNKNIDAAKLAYETMSK